MNNTPPPKVISNRVCKRCGVPLPKELGKYRVYCDACTLLNRRENLQRERICTDCGKPFIGFPKSKRCPECRDAARKRADIECYRRRMLGKSRKIGETYKCEICGKDYILTAGRQRFCSDCAEKGAMSSDAAASRAYNAAHRDQIHDRRRSQRVCIICGRPIAAKTSTVTCADPNCVRARHLAMSRESDARRGIGTHDPDYVVTRVNTPQKDD